MQPSIPHVTEHEFVNFEIENFLRLTLATKTIEAIDTDLMYN